VSKDIFWLHGAFKGVKTPKKSFPSLVTVLCSFDTQPVSLGFLPFVAPSTPKLISKMADMMYFMGQNKKKEQVKKKEREEKAKLKDVNMAAPSFDRAILNEQHQRDKDAKAKERAQPKENAKFDMARSLFGPGGGEEEVEEQAEAK
jgi:hypothetical protein